MDASLRLLLVDDDPLICEILSSALEAHDHTTVVASSYDEAKALYSENSFDILLTDVDLRGDATGIDLALACLEDGVPAILMSGHPMAHLERLDARIVDLEGVGWLRKPFALPLLYKEIASLEVARSTNPSASRSGCNPSA